MIRWQPIPRQPVDPSVLALLVVALLVALAHAAPASAATIDCGEEPQGTVIRFVTFPGIEVPSQPGDQCSDTFQCGEPVVTGSMVEKADPTCDPEIGACAVRLRFSLTFRGNRENIDDVGLFGAPTPVVYWFEGEADMDCRPWLDAGCGQIGVCGLPTGKISTDTIDIYLQLGSASCANPTPTQHGGGFSIMAASCPSRFSCPKREFDTSSVTPASVKQGLGCVIPPMQPCNGDASCTACLTGGVGVGGGGASGGGPAGPGGPDGEGAYLYYYAGGAGATGLPGTAAWRVALGRHWSHDYAMRIVPAPDETRVFLITEHAAFREWSAPDLSGVYQSIAPSDEYRTLTWLGAGLGWELRDLDGTVDLFDEGGLWLSRTDRNGNAKVATYSGSQLVAVDFPDETHEEFDYDPTTGKLVSITKVGVDGVTSRTWGYTWTGDDLTRVDRPDGTALLYHYDEPSFPGYMTRVEVEGTDGTSIRVERAYEYDAEGNVVASWRGDVSKTGPDAVDLWQLAFDDPAQPTQTTVTDPLGNDSIYQLARDTVSSNVKVTSISGDCPTCGLGPNTQLFYEDSNHPMLPTRTVDGRGFTTVTSYTASGEVESRTEAMGEPEERTTTWTYDATYPALVESIEQPSVAGGAALRTTDFTRDAKGNAFERTITGMESGSGFSYLTETSYNVSGMPLTIDPPGHGTDDVTSFTYDPARGNLLADSRTDPLIGTTTYDHDAFNRRTSTTDPNGVESTTSYDDLDRVTEVRQVSASPPTDDLVTEYEYTVFGDLLRTTLPEGNVIEYGYDAAGRLIAIERKPDASTPGERVLYSLDGVGNRTNEKLQWWDAGSSAWVTTSETEYDYSTRCHLDRTIQAPGTAEESVTELDYDCNGNPSAQWDPNHDAETDPPTTSYTYDALDRLETVSQPWAGGGSAVTTYSYDVQDHLVGVTDAEGNTTTYVYSDRDLLTQEVSPVSGTTVHTYDEHGELDTTQDARGITVDRMVDALDRVTFIDYLDNALDVTYTYDTAPAACGGTSFPVGRLGSITRNGASVESCYDRFGRQTLDGELIYAWDGNSNRTGIAYPGGVSATYGFDFADREMSLTVTTSGGTENVVTAATYLPSGPLSSLALDSGTTETRAFDGRYAPTAIGISGDPMGVGDRTWSYTTDRVGNVLSIVETAGGACAGTLVLENQTVTTTETFTACADLQAGNGFSVESPGDVLFEAVGKVILTDGFLVGSGASFVAATLDSVPPLSTRTYQYQAPQYFLTLADGPWGTRDWTYDRIGNRLSETRDGGTPDTYVYASNGTGNTPILDQVTLGVGGTRDYTWGAAGHLEEVDAAGNVIDFQNDAAGRLSGVSRAIASETADFRYDGRSFLTTAAATAGGTSSVTPLYDSAGLLHALRRKDAPANPEELIVHLYLAGRPVAQVAIDGGSSTETWTYLTTDHLGTPMLATDEAGVVVWEGGFEPFGTDYQAGSAAGASENGIFLRLPGQWEEKAWAEASSGAGIAYNVARWLEPQTGRYTRPDPLAPVNTSVSFAGPSASGDPGIEPIYGYARMNPLLFIDPLGLKSRLCCRKIPWVPASHCYIQIERGGETTTCGLHGGRFSEGEEAGVGQIRGPNTFDDPTRSDCGPWNEECGTDECVIKTADDYANPSVYGAVSTSNSNSFAGHVARKCGLTRPENINRPRGWNRPPATAKHGREKIPSPCKLPGK